ncbi:hypothetical protein GBZ26_03315 [Azospirillum formosense]|uniref:Uncharacterized protein n=1 Tax=Azospirillum formosense TaxID=861533 RepID=A0ABX2KWR0_9PROT|nr:hypothetical protein [Azospirillum formosense]MBY3752760.1 hypothetical protein [Azospirillum formosense]NUB18256.1 hypothetical protein [Azospirillum formosense]
MTDSDNATPLPETPRATTLSALSVQLAAALSDPDASDARWDLAEMIATSIPTTPAEAVVVVGLLTNADIGLEAGQTEVHLTAARSLEAGLRAMATAPEADAFGAAISAFDQAAERALALPLEPTPAMVDAAVAATGCTAAKARAGFAAMVEAFRREAA